jgi:hypothetical protein
MLLFHSKWTIGIIITKINRYFMIQHTYLQFGQRFNQSSLLPIEKGVFPDSLTNLTFGICFDQPIKKDVLPDSFDIGFYFN